MLDDKAQEERVKLLWKQAFNKAVGVSKILSSMRIRDNALFSMGIANPANLHTDIKPKPVLKRMKTFEKVKELSSNVINPTSNWKSYWDLLINYHLVYTAIFVPYQACFVDAQSSDAQFIYDCWMDSCFLTDIVLTFFTAIPTKTGGYISDKRVIAKTYIKGWFFIDFFTSLPFQVLERIGDASSLGDTKMLRIMRLPRLARFLRLAKLARLLK
jgi:hypothetical protein